jgi:hypothetical protein
MNYDDILIKITNKDYHTKLPYPDYATNNAYELSLKNDAKKAYRDDNQRLYRAFGKDMKQYFEHELGKPLTDKQFSAIYSYAWEEGHSAGYHEVLLYASNLIDIVKEFITKE